MLLFVTDLELWLAATPINPITTSIAATTGPPPGGGLLMMAAGLIIYISCLYLRSTPLGPP